MKKITSFLGMLFACVWLPASLSAAGLTQLQAASGLNVLKDGKVVERTAPPRQHSSVSRASLASAGDLAGEWVQTYTTLVSSGRDGGKSVTVATDPDVANGIKFTNFYNSGYEVKATVDVAAGTVSIASQKVYTDSKLGELEIAYVSVPENGAPVADKTKPVEGTVNADGTISITSAWGIFTATDGKAVGLFSGSELEKANATMTQKMLVTSTTPISYKDVSYNVVVRQTASNVLSVKNFGNYGKTVELILNADRSAKIPSQLAWEDATYGNFYTKSISYDPTTGQLTDKVLPVINTDIASDTRSVSWKNWSMVNPENLTYLAVFTEGKFTTPFDISYPSSASTGFEGEGTEASPYLVKSVADLVLLADKVNGVEEKDYNSTDSDGKKYASVFAGKYFRLDADIDLGGYQLLPIGQDFYHRFAGVFDGNNHVISNLSISTGSAGFAALFGLAESSATIKNLTVKNAKVRAQGMYAATIAGVMYGTIENCHVTNADVYNTARATGGLVGVVGTVRNSSIEKSRVEGLGGNVGGLAAEVDALISGSHASEMTVVASADEATLTAGGLTASLYKADATDCYFSGMLESRTHKTEGMYLGGITGTIWRGSIERCFSVGTIAGYGPNTTVGGIAGSLFGTISDSYSSGAVLGPQTKKSGGIVGYVGEFKLESGEAIQSTVKNCYTSAYVETDPNEYDVTKDAREIIGKVQENTTPQFSGLSFDRQVSNFGSQNWGLTTAELTKASGVAGLDASVWAFAEGEYPRLKAVADNAAAEMGASVVLMPAGSSFGKLSKNAALKPVGSTDYFLLKDGALVKDGSYAAVSGMSLLVKDEFGTDTLVVKNGSVENAYVLNVVPIPFEGEGTEQSPYLLKTKDDLVNLSVMTSTRKQQFAGTYFALANDIDMEYSADFLGISYDKSDVNNQFAGVIDGGGHTLHKLLIDKMAWKVRPEDDPDNKGGQPDNANCSLYGGFVGRLAATGVVKNLTVAADARISFWATSGVFVAVNQGLVENCRNYAEVKGYSSRIGGIVGENSKGGYVRNCYNAGNVTTGYTSAGGISGYNYGFIENSANVGDISARSISKNQTNTRFINTVGGITGSSNGDVIRNVVNAGEVYSAGTRAGGIVGYHPKVTMTNISGHNDLTYAVNIGIVSGSDRPTLGAISGECKTEGTVEGNYYDVQILPLKAASNSDREGMNGVETSALTSGKALDGFDSNLWDFTAGQYPVLKQFATEEKLAAARKAVVAWPSGVNADDASKDATLATVEGLAWSLKQGKVFTVSGNTLKAPLSVDKLTFDTLVAKTANYEKRIAIQRIPAVPLAGEGTKESPYLIASADNWNALADYMATVEETFKDKFLKVSADIDFTGKEFKPLATGDVAVFQGTLDGNGKKVSGISLTSAEYGTAAIRTIGESGSVSNLTLAGEINSTSNGTGGFSAFVYGTLTDCVSEINVTSTSTGDRTSGFGFIYASAKLTGCVNKGAVSGAGANVAGLAAEVEEGVTFVRCGNEGTVTNTGSSKKYTAGLVAESLPARYEECYNTGKVVVTDKDKSENVAGLIGYATSGKKDVKMTLVKCWNAGDVEGAGIVGGLIAASDGSSSYTNPITLTECYNTGNISAVASSGKSSGRPTAGLVAFYTPGSTYTDCYNTGAVTSPHTYVAGIAGYQKSGPTEQLPLLISGCYNTGKITGEKNGVAGIIADMGNYSTVEQCYNTGAVNGGYGSAGIAGRMNSVTARIANSWNSGNITTSLNRTGGLVGYGTKGAVENSFNVGNVTSTATEGGTSSTKSGYAIGGLAGQGGAAYTNCYNTGVVTGQSQVGGLIGVPYSGTTKLVNCYNIGKVVAPADTCGALIGAYLTDKVWTAENVVENCYYVTGGNEYKHNAKGTETTLAELAALEEFALGWTVGDAYTLPRISMLADEPAALVNAVVLGFADGDTQQSVTKDFFVGAPEGLTWTASEPNLTFSGTNAVFSNVEFVGKITLRATAGDYGREFEIECSKPSGIDSQAIEKTVVKEIFYNAAGLEVQRPEHRDGAVYIVVRTYDDGTTSAEKFFN